MDINVLGVDVAESGNGWFIVDKTGEFSLDKTAKCTFWLVGGGCDGTDGFSDSEGVYHGGIGGQGGFVYKIGKIKLKASEKCSVIVGNANEPAGTSIKLYGKLFKCDNRGHTCAFGGAGGIVNNNLIVQPRNGKDGVLTPYGYVGSGGAGGVCAVSANNYIRTTDLAKGGKGAGNSRAYIVNGIDWNGIKDKNPEINAANYGCGGGGNTYCIGLRDIGVKTKGKGGCVVVQYEEVSDIDSNSDYTIRFWN